MAYSDDQLLQALRDCKQKHGEVTTTLLTKDDSLPSGPTYGYRFESLANALEKAGLTDEAKKARNRSDRKRGSWTKDKVIDTVQSISEDGKVTVKMLQSNDGPSRQTIVNNLDIDSIDELKEVAGVEFTTERMMSISSKDDVKNGLLLADSDNDYVTHSLLDDDNEYPSMREVRYHYNTLTNTAEELGLDTGTRKRREISDFVDGSYIYIVELKDGSYQVGSSTSPSQAIDRVHQNKSVIRVHSIVAVDSDLYDVEKELVERVAEFDSWDNVVGKLSEERVKVDCDNCGDTFSRTAWKVNERQNNFCTEKCKTQFNREQRVCVVCGDSKQVPKSEYEHKDGWVCSDECNRQKYRHEIECVVCGSTKEELESTTDKRKLPYRCSDECKKEWAYVQVSCDNCGKSFDKKRSHARRTQNDYCSRDCLSESQENESARNEVKHNRWANRVKEQADYTCEICGESYDVMTAHHEPPKSELPEDRMYDTDVGMCLCYECHAEQHTGGQREALLSWWDWYTASGG